jgi:hypothetical protein
MADEAQRSKMEQQYDSYCDDGDQAEYRRP